jgi:hypothetical protein
MSKISIDSMVNGWFIGDFEPSVFKTSKFEVAVKIHEKDEYVQKHYHKIAIEYTIIIEGVALMNGIEYHKGDIIEVKPLMISDFKAITEVKSVVVKIPSCIDDKYLV